jgi:biotin synthase-like enzyme
VIILLKKIELTKMLDFRIGKKNPQNWIEVLEIFASYKMELPKLTVILKTS